MPRLAFYLNSEHAIYRCRSRCHSTPSVHKWLNISSRAPMNPHISLHTLICLHPPRQNQPSPYPSLPVELLGRATDLLDRATEQGHGPLGRGLGLTWTDSITLLVPFRRFQVMCSTRFKQISLRTCRTLL